MMRSSIVTIALIALCAWLGWSAYEETKRPLPGIDSQGRATGAEIARGAVKSERKRKSIIFPPLETLGEIVARPLFNVSRRPIAVEKTVPVVKPADLNVMLSGIVIGEARQIAHLRSPTDKRTLALSVGDKIGDWRIQSIFPDRVVLQAGSRVETLFMQKPGANKSASGSTEAAGAKPSSRRKPTRSNRRARRNYRRTNRGSE